MWGWELEVDREGGVVRSPRWEVRSEGLLLQLDGRVYCNIDTRWDRLSVPRYGQASGDRSRRRGKSTSCNPVMLELDLVAEVTTVIIIVVADDRSNLEDLLHSLSE